MLNSLLGTKVHMTQVFDQAGKRWSATAIQAGPCTVAQVKNIEQDGYRAVQLSFGTRKRVNQPKASHLKKAGILNPVKYLREFFIEEQNDSIKPGATFTAKDIFQPGDVIRVTGISKGKGFAGVMKRWGFHGGPRTHGQSDRKRAPGSIGAGTTPGRVLKGKKMAGRMGTNRITIKGLKIIRIDEKNNLILVSGPVPGANKELLLITKTGHDDKFTGVHKSESIEKLADIKTPEVPESQSDSE